MRYALVNEATLVVENVIELDEASDWPVPPGYITVKTDVGNVGDIYRDGELIRQE